MNMKTLIATVSMIVALTTSSNAMDESQFNQMKKEGMITTFGNYVSTNNKIDTPWGSHYYLPSDTFMKKTQSEYSEVFWTNGFAWGNFNGDNTPDLLMAWELHTQCQGQMYEDKHTGTYFCLAESLDDKRGMLPFSIFEVDANGRESLDHLLINDVSIAARNCMRPIVADFNSDGIDDTYCGSAFGVKHNLSLIHI